MRTGRSDSPRTLVSNFIRFATMPRCGCHVTQSHGEAFLALFENRVEDGMYLLDEPEAALSPQRQLTFLSILHQLASMKVAQFIIATHSPILLTLPNATVLSIDEGRLREVNYKDTEHYQLTRDFLNKPERYHRHLFQSGDTEDE